MFSARRLLLLGATAVTGLAMAASTASAQPEVITEPEGEHCPEISVEGHAVSGGCHLEGSSSGDVSLHIYIPHKITISRCELVLEGRTNGNAEGYITAAAFEPPLSGGVPCTRRACTEEDGPMMPWPSHLRENGPGDEEIRTEYCVSPLFSSAGNWCELHSTFIDLGDHQYQLGTGQEEFCENSPGGGYSGSHPVLSFPITIEAQIQTSGIGEDFEVVH